MAKNKAVDYPGLSASDAIDSAKKIVETYSNKSFKMASLANTLGHKTEKSGTFLLKLGDLRRYKLIDGRGEFTASELAKKIAHPLNEGERIAKTREMIFNVAIFKQLYDVFQSNKTPSLEEIQAQLLNITNIDRAELPKISEEIRKLYIDAVSHIPSEGMTMQHSIPSASHISSNVPQQQNRGANESLDEDMTSFHDKGIDVVVRKDVESLETAIAFLNIHLTKLKNKRKD